MNERETKTFTTPLGKTLVIKSYMTAGEREQLLKPDGTVLDNVEASKKYIEIMVVSYDGSSTGIVETVRHNVPVVEHDFVVSECIKAATGDFQPVK